MEMDKYTAMVQDTALYREMSEKFVAEAPPEKLVKLFRIFYTITGLSGEVGEIQNKIKKIIRDGNGEVTDEMVKDFKSEMGDVFWYFEAFIQEFGLTLNDVAQANYDKITDRKKRDVLHGSGDNR
jgi:NTP pyrophosphatase (non-canonical NTP hydrolase)